MTDPNSHQVGGAHYASKYQHWDFVLDAGLGYFEGQITKYVARYRKKNGLQDLQKALHFLDKLISRSFAAQLSPETLRVIDQRAEQFCKENEIEGDAARVIMAVSKWDGRVNDLYVARGGLESLIAEISGTAPTARYTDQG